jgi:hypothetical protein
VALPADLINYRRIAPAETKRIVPIMALPAPFEKGLSRLGIDVGGVLTVDTDTDVKEPKAGGAKGPGLAIAMQVRGPALSLPHRGRIIGMTMTQSKLHVQTCPRGRADLPQGKPPAAECVAAVRQLVAHFGAEHVFILSKCSTRVQQATAVWRGSHDVFARPGGGGGYVVA